MSAISKIRAVFAMSLLGLSFAVFAQGTSQGTAQGAAPGTAQVAKAAEFRSVAVPAAVLWDGPSAKGKKLFAAPRGMPLEVLSVVNNWVKVRDSAGDVLWVERAELSTQRTVVVTTNATVRSSPLDSATIVFQAERGVLLDLTDPAAGSGWVKVKHRDGSLGFVKTAEVWGL